MKDRKRMVELMAEVVIELWEVKGEIKGQRDLLQHLTHRVDNLSLGVGELRLSVMRLADAVEHVGKHEERLQRLEAAVFKP